MSEKALNEFGAKSFTITAIAGSSRYSSLVALWGNQYDSFALQRRRCRNTTKSVPLVMDVDGKLGCMLVRGTTPKISRAPHPATDPSTSAIVTGCAVEPG